MKILCNISACIISSYYLKILAVSSDISEISRIDIPVFSILKAVFNPEPIQQRSSTEISKIAESSWLFLYNRNSSGNGNWDWRWRDCFRRLYVPERITFGQTQNPIGIYDQNRTGRNICFWGLSVCPTRLTSGTSPDSKRIL